MGCFVQLYEHLHWSCSQSILMPSDGVRVEILNLAVPLQNPRHNKCGLRQRKLLP